MLVSTQQSISDLSGWKTYFSNLKNYFHTHGLTKEGVNSLYKVINDDLPMMSIGIGRDEGIRLRSILSNFNQDQNYRGNTGDCEFMVDLITSILQNIGIQCINTLKGEQDDLQQELTPLKQSMTTLARIVTPRRYREYEDKKRELKNTVKNKWKAVIQNNEDTLGFIQEKRSINFNDRIQKLEDHIKALKQDLNNLSKDKKILRSEEGEYDNTKETLKSQLHKARKEKWQTVLDQKFEENRNKPLDKVAEATGSSYIKEETKKNSYNNNYCYYKVENGSKSLEFRTLKEILDRANPTHQDKKILLKWDIYRVKALLKDETLTKEKEDRKALKEIYQDLKDELKKSKKDFNSQNDGYIQSLRETRSVPPQSIVEAASVQQEQRDISTASVSMP